MKQKEPARMTAAQARVDIWEKLRKVARPDSRFSWEFSEFITDYEGSDKCAELLTATQMYKDAKVIFLLHRIITWKSSESRPSWTKKLSS